MDRWVGLLFAAAVQWRSFFIETLSSALRICCHCIHVRYLHPCCTSTYKHIFVQTLWVKTLHGDLGQTIRVFAAAQSEALNNNASGFAAERPPSVQTHTAGLWEERDDKDGCFSCLYYLSICRLCNASVILLCCIRVSDSVELEGVKMLSTRHTSSSEPVLLRLNELII